MKLVLLGTGHAMATKYYNTCFIFCDQEEYFLVDAGGGNGILRQLELAQIDYTKIRHIFVTHKHIDHIMGIIWMIRAVSQKINQKKYEGQLYIYAHDDVIKSLKKMVSMLLIKKQAKTIGEEIHLITVKDGQTYEILGRETTFFDIHSTKTKQFGFTMKLGEEEKLTCCGDEPYRECEEEYAKDSTWLMHEAFCLDGQADIFKPYEKHHSTAKDAAEIAQKLHIKNLILYHTEDKTFGERKRLYTEEAKKYFDGNIYVPDDLECFELS